MPRRNAPSPPSKGARPPRRSKKHLGEHRRLPERKPARVGDLRGRSRCGRSSRETSGGPPTHARTRRPVGTSTYEAEGTVRLDEERTRPSPTDEQTAEPNRPRGLDTRASRLVRRRSNARVVTASVRHETLRGGAEGLHARGEHQASEEPAVSKRFPRRIARGVRSRSGCTKAAEDTRRPRPSSVDTPTRGVPGRPSPGSRRRRRPRLWGPAAEPSGDGRRRGGQRLGVGRGSSSLPGGAGGGGDQAASDGPRTSAVRPTLRRGWRWCGGPEARCSMRGARDGLRRSREASRRHWRHVARPPVSRREGAEPGRRDGPSTAKACASANGGERGGRGRGRRERDRSRYDATSSV